MTDHREVYDATILILVTRNLFHKITKKVKMQQADGFIVDPMVAPTLTSGETGAIRKFFKEYT